MGLALIIVVFGLLHDRPGLPVVRLNDRVRSDATDSAAGVEATEEMFVAVLPDEVGDAGGADTVATLRKPHPPAAPGLAEVADEHLGVRFEDGLALEFVQQILS